MRILDLLEREDFRRLRTVYALGGAIDDGLKWNAGERILRIAKRECAGEEAQMDAARHLEQRIE